MKKFFKGTLVTCLVTIGGGLAFADSVSESSFNAGLTAGTLGVGINLSTPISDSLSARVNVNGLQYSHTLDVDNIRYDGDIDFKNAGLLVDYFPFESTFRVSGGVYYNGNEFDGSATPFGAEKITIGNNIYTASEVGKLNTHVEFDNVAPYLGIGWGNNSNEKGWGYSFDLGVMYQGSPKVDLNADLNPLIIGTPIEDEINSNLVIETQKIIDEVEDYKFYPVVMIGVNYKF